jgi:hypothetical protein
MGIEKINFMWYVRKVSMLAFMGYMAGAVTFAIQHEIVTHGLSGLSMAALSDRLSYVLQFIALGI